MSIITREIVEVIPDWTERPGQEIGEPTLEDIAEMNAGYEAWRNGSSLSGFEALHRQVVRDAAKARQHAEMAVHATVTYYSRLARAAALEEVAGLLAREIAAAKS